MLIYIYFDKDTFNADCVLKSMLNLAARLNTQTRL